MQSETPSIQAACRAARREDVFCQCPPPTSQLLTITAFQRHYLYLQPGGRTERNASLWIHCQVYLIASPIDAHPAVSGGCADFKPGYWLSCCLICCTEPILWASLRTGPSEDGNKNLFNQIEKVYDKHHHLSAWFWFLVFLRLLYFSAGDQLRQYVPACACQSLCWHFKDMVFCNDLKDAAAEDRNNNRSLHSFYLFTINS